MNIYKLVYLFRYLLLLLVFLVATCFSLKVFGQNLVDTNNSCFQEVVVRYQGYVIALRRDISEDVVGSWEIVTPRHKLEKARICQHKQITTENAKKLIGTEAYRYIEKQFEKTGLSGYYNFSGNTNYDWPEFGGDNFKAGDKIRITQNGTTA